MALKQPVSEILTAADREQILSDTIDRVADIHERMEDLEAHAAMIPEIKTLVTTLVDSTRVIANSADRMSVTFEKSEQRAETQQKEYGILSQTAAGKDQVPLKVFFWTIVGSLVPTIVLALGVVIYVLNFNDQELKASLTDISITASEQTKEAMKEEIKAQALETRRRLEDAKKEIQQQASEDNKEAQSAVAEQRRNSK